MKLIKILDQHRRDFTGQYKCEFCNHEVRDSGYDDRNFHDNVIPDMKCKWCEKSTKSEGGTIDNTPTKYSEHQTV